MPLIHPTGKPPPGAPTHADLTVRVYLGRQDLAGELIIEGCPVSTFTGWLSLLTGLDRAIDTLRPPAQGNNVV